MPRPMATSLTLTMAEPCAAAALAVADAPPSNWMMLGSMQRLAKNRSSLATWGEVCTTLGGATETPILILRIALQLCAAASRAAASAMATPPAATTMSQIDRYRFDMARFPFPLCLARSLVVLRRRGPGRHVFLGEAQQRCEYQAEEAEWHDRHEHLVHLIGARGAYDQISDAGDRGIEIGEHHADQAASERQPQSRHDERQRRRQDDVPPQL